MLKLLIVEDHALVRDGLIKALADLDYNGETVDFLCAGTAEEALDLLAGDQSIDLSIIDLMLPVLGGLGLLTALKNREMAAPVLVISAIEDAATVQRVLRLGAAGYVPKSTPTPEILEAIRTILDGGQYIPERYRATAPKRRGMGERFGLTPARMRVLELLVEGKTNREIAELMGITEGTAKLHVGAVLKALGASSRAQAATIASKNGMKAV